MTDEERKAYRAEEEFVTDKSGFVDPEKIEAIDLYGLEKAQEMWANGQPKWEVLNNLRRLAYLHYLAWK